MISQVKILLIVLLGLAVLPIPILYPIDGYKQTGIDRLLRLQRIMEGEIKGDKPPLGAQKSISEINLHLLDGRVDSLQSLPAPNPMLQKELNALFPNLDESYSIALLDITPGREIRYATREEQRGYQPGSVGKLVVLASLFYQLEKVYPGSFEKRQQLLRDKKVRGGAWVIYNEHEVPVYNPETDEFWRRPVNTSDIFSLYEWTDHMISASSNAAASVVWRELILMDEFKLDYPGLTEEQADKYFSETPKKELSMKAMALVNEPLRQLGISSEEWRLGKLFTSGATQIIPAQGGSIGTTRGMMKFLVAIEKGAIVDKASSLEIKRLLYLTDRRIRFSASPALTNAAVYFKSGSLYKCQPEEDFNCKKYMGNVFNFMNSVVIVEQPDGRTYLVCLMSNVLRKNSSGDHYELATKIDRLIKP